MARTRGLYVQQAIATGDPAFYPLAERAFDNADQITPDAIDTVVGRGALAASLHRFDEALRLGERALATNPRNLAALAVVVDANVELGRYDRAAQHLQDMLDTRPALVALSRVSYLRELHGDTDGAIRAMLQAREAGAARSFDIARVSALLRFNQGDLRGAESEYRRALDRAEDLPQALVGLARVSAARGDIQAAIADLEALTARVPLPEAVILLSDLRALAGDQQGAADADEVVRALATLQRESGQVVDLELALFEADRGNGRQALDLAQAAYESRPTIYAADAVAWALHATGDDEAAVPYITEALRLGTRDATLHYHAAQIHAGTGDIAAAKKHLTQAFKINPWFSFRHLDDARALAAELGVAVRGE